MALAAIARGVGIAGRVAARQKTLRNAQGRFMKAQPKDLIGMTQAALMTYKSPKAGCGKGQYKSLQCKAASILKNVQDTGNASSRQSQFLRNFSGFR